MNKKPAVTNKGAQEVKAIRPQSPAKPGKVKSGNDLRQGLARKK